MNRDGLDAKIEDACEFLESVRDDYEALSLLPYDLRQRFLMAAGQVARPGPWAKRELRTASRDREKARKKAANKKVLGKTGIRMSRRQRIFSPWLHGAKVDRNGGNKVQPLIRPRYPDAPAPSIGHVGHLEDPKTCYVCKDPYSQIHRFYDALCPSCADFNWNKRTPSADLSGRYALLTGARVKIGFHAALLLLRAGAHVVVTTRFASDAVTRYAAVEDYDDWSDRLEVFGLDLRHTPSVEAFARHLDAHLPQLDFLINNACQTVRRPAGFYDHLLSGENRPLGELPKSQQKHLSAYEALRDGMKASGPGLLIAAANKAGLSDPAALSQLALLEEDLDRSTHLFPHGALDADLQQVDLRETNSWRLGLSDVPAVELLEVQLVNAVAPFILNARLKPAMLRQSKQDRHIVNVSAVEGQFARRLKTDRHPHTNMAKAALNMMTRTSAADYVADGIHMNSVDTGWVTDEDPVLIAERKTREQDFHPPLDIVDGAARIVDPIFDGITTGRHTWGAFLKDYHAVDW